MAQTLEELASNLVGDEDSPIPPAELMPPERRVRIMLEESDQIPPTGQFFGVQGKGYVLRPGEAADVPMSIIGILNTAVMSVPVKDAGDRVVGYRDKLRFPYRVVTESRPA
jgi:hypothetical protein